MGAEDWANMSNDPFRMELQGPVLHWEYDDVAGILFGCLVLLLPLTAYVLGDDGEQD